jgi:metal-sulfur cluster biosynthetic enzyme
MNDPAVNRPTVASFADLFSEETVIEALRDVYDPELGVNIIDLGLVYGVEIDGPDIHIIMTLTTPGCPLHDMLTEAIDDALHVYLGTTGKVDVELVWDPRWTPDMITPAGLHELGWR